MSIILILFGSYPDSPGVNGLYIYAGLHVLSDSFLSVDSVLGVIMSEFGN